MQDLKTCICVVGPTNVGKTLIAFQLAQYFKTHILSFDSRQCYKQLNIGVAKPPPSILNQVHHYFINSHDIFQDLNVNDFLLYAQHITHTHFKTHNTLILVGGTGLYLHALANGINNLPTIPISIKNTIQQNIQQYGISWLQNQLQQKDPIYYQQIDPNNTYKLQRALEVFLTTQQSISEFYNEKKNKLPYKFITIGLNTQRQFLYQNINQRVNDMINNGLLQETQQLYPYRHLKALQTIGYTELFEHIEQKISLQQAIEKIQQNSRHYAKRQITWFSKDKQILWFQPQTPLPHIIKQINMI